uniref:Uncharacterized protein n=1 Tax=Panagrolaimus sp. JU765 TaxID=591449 RepID=A0AC34Q3Q4_9BILA
MAVSDALLKQQYRMYLLQEATNLFPKITSYITETSRLKKDMERIRMEAFSFEHSMILKTTSLWTRISKIEKCCEKLKKQNVKTNDPSVSPKPESSQTNVSLTSTLSEPTLSLGSVVQKLTEFGRELNPKQETKAIYGIVEVEDRFEKLMKDLDAMIASLDKIRLATPIIDGIERGHPDLDVELM